MASENSGQLIDDIIRFIEKERKLYGDFHVNLTATPESVQSAADQNKEKESATPTSQKKSKEHQTSAAMDGLESQENMFSDKSTPEVYYKIKDCKNLDELTKLCQTADVLKTDLKDTNLVFGVGNPDADLMLIGEAPGAEEDKQGEPFVGRAGQLLNDILAAINFERDDIYITNILKHRPPNNRNPKPEERRQSLPFLLHQIDLIQPKLILCLGKVAAQTLLDNSNSLGSMRGAFHSFRGKYELMATYHPAALLRHAKWKRPTWEDVQLLRKRYDELGCNP